MIKLILYYVGIIGISWVIGNILALLEGCRVKKQRTSKGWNKWF